MSLNKMDKPIDTLFYFLFQRFSNSSFKLLPVIISFDTRFPFQIMQNYFIVEFLIGLGISSYKWMAALTLIIASVFFMPAYLVNKIFTMLQFLNQRYIAKLAMIMAGLHTVAFL